MRQSLSRRKPRAAAGSLVAAAALSLLLAVVAVADQLGGRALVDHATEVYGPHDQPVSAGLLYGLLYTVAGCGVLLWLLAARSARAGSRWATPAAAVTVVVTAGLGLALLLSREYGDQVYPSVWGVLALLPAAAGVLALGLLTGGRRTGR